MFEFKRVITSEWEGAGLYARRRGALADLNVPVWTLLEEFDNISGPVDLENDEHRETGELRGFRYSILRHKPSTDREYYRDHNYVLVSELGTFSILEHFFEADCSVGGRCADVRWEITASSPDVLAEVRLVFG